MSADNNFHHEGWQRIGDRTGYHPDYIRKIWKKLNIPVRFLSKGRPILVEKEYRAYLENRPEE